MINTMFRRISGKPIFRHDITIAELADWVLYGRGELNIFVTDDASRLDIEKNILKRFGKNKDTNASPGIVTAKEALKYGREYSSIENWVAENSTDNLNRIKANLLASLNYAGKRSGKVHHSDGSLIGSVVFENNNGFFDILSITPTKESDRKSVIMTLLNSASRIGIDNLRVSNEMDVDAIAELVESGAISREAVRNDILNDKMALIVNKLLLKRYAFENTLAQRVRVKSKDLLAMEAVTFLKETTNGLKAQLKTLERKPDTRQEAVDRVTNLIDIIEGNEVMIAAASFVDHADVESDRAIVKTKQMLDMMADDQVLDNAMVLDIDRNFLSLYSNAMSSIKKLNVDKFGVFSTMSDARRNALTDKIENVTTKLNNLSVNISILTKYAYATQLQIEAEKVGSTTIDSLFESDIYKEDSDISGYSSFMMGTAYSPKEQMRILHKIIADVTSAVSRQIEVDGVLNNLQSKFEAVKKASPFATYERFMEHDDKGRSLGYMMSNLKYGAFNKEYSKFKKQLMKKYKLDSDFEYPSNTKDRLEYIRERDAFLNEHAERRFTSEYYDLSQFSFRKYKRRSRYS